MKELVAKSKCSAFSTVLILAVLMIDEIDQINWSDTNKFLSLQYLSQNIEQSHKLVLK